MTDFLVGIGIILAGAVILGFGTVRTWIRKRREDKIPPPPPRAGKHGIDIDYE
jgi:hypothetical protein